jgi:hypothetical protein
VSQKPEYVIDAANFDTFAGFVEECNRVFIRPFGGEWHGKLDAFNDYLWWGEGDYVIVWKGAEKSRQDFERESGKPGRKLYHALVEIIRDQEHVELRLE